MKMTYVISGLKMRYYFAAIFEKRFFENTMGFFWKPEVSKSPLKRKVLKRGHWYCGFDSCLEIGKY
ncbi:hypothetical protein DX873_15705 [Flagellimonas nanhaiensis]|uniref:Uncharacterized protein n=1 Tax=Flagellimonas nanhaiensis TaxID=2292706 RepID=A0A371JMV6_9FLAO|nr:hypothetical protein DX873_15705 [Allomuricauda nanhaiensis]